MKEIKSNRLFIFFILITAISSWFSIGFYHVDEHFQILEFGAYKAGWMPPQVLPWEFSSALRSSLQPFIVFIVIEKLRFLGVQDPFIVAFFLRLLTAALCITCFGLWRKKLRTNNFQPGYVKGFDVALLLWFIPYLAVRFSSEIWGGCFFFISLALIYQRQEPARSKYFLAGCLAAFAFFFRFQTGFLIAGLMCFYLIHFRRGYLNVLWYVIGFGLILSICVYLDYLFYHRVTFTPWNYFRENIIHSRAAEFGTEPVYYYLTRIIMDAVPMQGILIIGAFIIFIIKRFRDEITFAVVCFIAAHFVTAHKEVRFLFPLVMILPFVFSYSFNWISSLKFFRRKACKIIIHVIIITNILLLIPAALKPSDMQVAWQRAIYSAVSDHKTLVAYEKVNPFKRVGLDMNFYKNKNMNLLPADSLKQNVATVEGNQILLTTAVSGSTAIKDHPELNCIYQDIPQWILNIDTHHLLAGTLVHRVYVIK